MFHKSVPIFLFYNISMKFPLILALLLTIAATQQGACQTCLKIKQCDPSLLSDYNIDPIYISITKQLNIDSYPLSITKAQSGSQLNYTFAWQKNAYLATVDLATRAFKVVEVTKTQSTSDYETSLINKIDSDIRAKYFQGENPIRISIEPVEGGYHAVYQKSDGSIMSFDSAVQRNGNSVLVSYQVCKQSTVNNANSGKSVVQQTSTSFSQQYVEPVKTATSVQSTVVSTSSSSSLASSSSQQFQSQTITQAPPQPQPQPQPQPRPTPNIVGGYQQLSQPLSNQGVQNVLNYLIQNIGSIIKSASLLSVQRQTVNGYNYRLTLTFDSNSTTQYVIVVYQSINGNLSISSLQMTNVASSYNFGAALTSSQASSLPYVNSLLSAVSSQLNSTVTAGIVLDAIYYNYPYFQLVYHSTYYQQIVLVVLYDVLRNNATIINSSAVPAQTQPQPQPQPSPQPQSNDLEYQPISSQLKQQSFISAYVAYLATTDSKLSLSTLSGIFWKVSDHNYLRFVFTFSDGTTKQMSASCDYIQYTLSRQKTQTSSKVPNCLTQNGGKCTKCSFKYFLSSGVCKPVQIQCSDFNYDTNTCEGCYTGFYLDYSGICQRANYLCQTSDRKGNCLTCYKDYRLTYKGKCAYIAEGASQNCPEQESNPLCAKFNLATCLTCVQGCYLNKSKICKIPDPNCDRFDEDNEICKVCLPNYSLSQSSRACVPIGNY